MTLGCKVNQYDAEQLREQFERADFETVSFETTADAYVIASCAVTGEAAAKTRRMVRRARRKNSGAVVALLGCYPQAVLGHGGDAEEEDRLRQLPADLVSGVGERESIVSSVKELIERRGASDHRRIPDPWRDPPDSIEHDDGISNFDEHTRAFVKIQDGCDQFCSYCLIPHLRGPLRARRSDDILRQAQQLIRAGHREIVLTGIHLGAYERSSGADATLANLVESLCSISGNWRLRLSSLEPMDVEEDLFETLAQSRRAAPHLHLPLQHGSDAVLREMARPYSSGDFRQLIVRLRELIPGVGVSTDVMVGFPGENDSDHRQNLEFVREIRFSRLHVFPYSRRPGTRATEMEGEVPPEVKRRRRDDMLKLGRLCSSRFHEMQVGKMVEVLVERSVDGAEEIPVAGVTAAGEIYHGYSGNYVPVWFSSSSRADLTGELWCVEITEACSEGCWGQGVGPSSLE